MFAQTCLSKIKEHYSIYLRIQSNLPTITTNGKLLFENIGQPAYEDY